MARILSVEDDPDFQYLVSHSLRNQGWDVHYAFTGKEGYEKALSLKPDLILLDMMLPVYDGAEVARRLKAEKSTRDIPIVVLTAFADQTGFFESGLKRIGVVEYLRKPVRLKELTSVIKRVLAGSPKRPPEPVWQRGVMRISAESRTVWVDDRLIANLAPRRFEVLFLLMQKKGDVPWEELRDKVWGRTGTKNDLEKTVQRLRADLGPEKYRVRTTARGYHLDI